MKKNAHEFVVCVNNAGYAVSLERGKIYPLLGAETVGRQRLLRIMDESGEDYLYPPDFFLPIELPKPVGKALLVEA